MLDNFVYVKLQMIASGDIRLGKLDCKSLNCILLKLLIDVFHLHIYFVVNIFVFEGIIELFSNRKLGSGIFLNTKMQGKNTP